MSMDYLSQDRNQISFETRYSSHLTADTQFPQISAKHNDLMRRNWTEFYPQKGYLRRSNTTLAGSPNILSESTSKTGVIPIYKVCQQKFSVRSKIGEMEGLKVPDIYSAMRNSLYTRYTVNDWIKSNQVIYGNSDRTREVAEQIRGDSLRLARQMDDRTNLSQNDSKKKLGDRIVDTDKLKVDIDTEIENIIAETDRLLNAKLVTQKALEESENPLNTAQECLYNREKRARIDLVHDNVEKELLKEVDVIKECQNKLAALITRAGEQLKKNRSAQYHLEKDSRDKYHAIKLDNLAYNMKNSSSGIAFHGGVEYLNNCVSTPKTWANFTLQNLEQAGTDIEASQKLREEMEYFLNQCQNDMWRQCNEVNVAFSRRIQEEIEARNKDQAHLRKVLQEISDTEKNIEYLKKAIIDKLAPMKVAQSRLNIRLNRPNMEDCDDQPRNRLLKEIEEINNSEENLKKQLRIAERALQNLLNIRADIETDMNIKNNSIFIDRDECLGIRKTFSIKCPSH